MLKHPVLLSVVSSTCLMATLSTNAQADHRHWHSSGNSLSCYSGSDIDRQQKSQQRQIQQAYKSHDLTRNERNKLQNQQDSIAAMEKKFRQSDNCLTRYEVNKLTDQLRQASNDIYKLSHNNDKGGSLQCLSGNNIDKEQATQAQLIKKGYQRGQLTDNEKYQLNKEQNKIKEAEKRFRKSDRCLTKYEVQKLTRQLDTADSNIHDLRYNSKKRPIMQCVSGDRIDDRQYNQKRRIRKGINRGEISRWEARKLRREQRQIRWLEEELRQSDNCLTKQEAKRLMQKLDEASDSINQYKNNYRYSFNFSW